MSNASTILDEVMRRSGEKRSLLSRLRKFRAQLAMELSEVHWAFLIANFLLWPLPKEAGGHIRAAVYRRIGIKIGRGTSIGKGVHIEGMGRPYGRLSIGEGCWIRGARFELNERVTVGNRIVISDDCLITTDTHEVGPPEQRFGRLTSRPVVIGDGAWIARKSMILGVNVGAGSIVASNAVVTKDVPPNTMVGGVPAKVIRELPTNGGPVERAEIDEQVAAP
jgi:maltose O-acetyltransferase